MVLIPLFYDLTNRTCIELDIDLTRVLATLPTTKHSSASQMDTTINFGYLKADVSLWLFNRRVSCDGVYGRL